MPHAAIEVRGASTHNLRNVDADIPLGKVTAVTGVSGSGKSSLAVDTVYAEAQRRYVESLSAYARQFLERLERPDFERIDFLPPAISVGQSSRPRTARARVGTMSGLSDLIQLLWAAESKPVCPRGHGAVNASFTGDRRTQLLGAHAGHRALIVAPNVRVPKEELIRSGYTRAIDEELEIRPLAETDGHSSRVLIDRLVLRDGPRLSDALSQAFRLSGGRAELRFPDSGEAVAIMEELACAECGFQIPKRQARLFSPISAFGACPHCGGFGRAQTLDPDRVVPDPTKSLRENAVVPWATPARAKYRRALSRLAEERGLRLDVPWQSLEEWERTVVWEGDRALRFPGVKGFFARLERKRYKMTARVLLARYRGFETCEPCGGSGLRAEALAYRMGGLSIAELERMTIDQIAAWLGEQKVDAEVSALKARIQRRLDVLRDIGLGYLSAEREGRTLSSGEARRLHLTSALGAGVTGTLYVLDEPSIGLHARDTGRLAAILRRLADAGNTVVLVEHDRDLILASDSVLELGPGSGRRGGELVFRGPPAELLEKDTATGRAFAQPLGLEHLPVRGRGGAPLGVRGARARTLKGFDCRIPRGALTCITGVSGSGKSTFLHLILARNLARALSGAHLEPSVVDRFEGLEGLREVHLIDTSPLARSVRSIPVTYIDAWTGIRGVLAAGSEARKARLGPKHFSFNSPGGRCEACKGLGSITVDMQFLADVEVCCDACDGKRFSRRVLEVSWNGLDVDQVLKLSVDEARVRFAKHPSVVKKLAPLSDVGLGYLALGQPTSTLSAGEAQRLKLAAHLGRRARVEGMVFLLDEPSSGLHAADIERLLQAFDALIDRGATIVVVEHNLDVVRRADHILDLGPEAAHEGGSLVFEGTIDGLLEAKGSHTAEALRMLLDRRPR